MTSAAAGASDDTRLERGLLLPYGVTAEDVGEACRHAALSFCRGVASGWTKRDLAEWLLGPYEAAALSVRGSRPSRPSPPRTPRAPLEESRIQRVMDPAWQGAIGCIEDFARAREAAHLDEALDRGSIGSAWTSCGTSLFVPLNREALPLAVRVRSLLVVDFLLRPEDYDGEVGECNECGLVLLGPWARRRGHCEEHVRVSEIVPMMTGEVLAAPSVPAWRQPMT
jgi:hypothetical protein